MKQAHRTLDNVQALLEGYGATLDDLKSIVVYLRDPSDLPMIQNLLDERMPPSTSYIIVRGAVCRPTWLIEMDGIAVNDLGDKRFKDFC